LIVLGGVALCDHGDLMSIVMPAIREEEVHLYYAADDVRDERLLAIYWSVLNSEERLRHDRFRFKRDQRQYLVTRALVRWVLSQRAGVAPEEFVFSTNAWGKPEIRKPSGLPLRFNAANTRGMVACVVALAHDVGVDVEDTTRLGETVGIAERFFSKAEVEELRALPAQLQRERFFDYWTLKEAYVKGRGMGLSMPLHKFTINFNQMSDPTVFVEPDVDDAARWQLRLTFPTACHRLASAVCLGDGPPLTLLLHSVVPFAGELSWPVETSKYPPAEPGALGREPLKTARRSR
jgi:4'-phosphopantetheinyl transferase